MKKILIHISQEDRRIVPILFKLGVKIKYVNDIESNIVNKDLVTTIGQFIPRKNMIIIRERDFFKDFNKRSSFISTLWHETIHAINYSLDKNCFKQYKKSNFGAIITSESIAEITTRIILGDVPESETIIFIEDILEGRWGETNFDYDTILSYINCEYATEMRKRILDFVNNVYVF